MNRTSQIRVLGFFLVAVIVVFFVAALTKKTYIKVDFTRILQNKKTVEIAQFEEGEGWMGNFSFESGRAIEGKTSLTLSSWYGKTNTIERTKSITVQTFTRSFISVYLPQASASTLKFLTLVLTNDAGKNQAHNLETTLKPGWNILPISIPSDWKKIERIQLSILAKPNTITEVNIDRFWLESGDQTYTHIVKNHSSALSTKTVGARTYLFSGSDKEQTYQFVNLRKTKSSLTEFSLIPEREDQIKLSLNHILLKLSKQNKRECFVTNGTKKVKTKLADVQFENDYYLFIRAKSENGTVVFSLSNNGVDYEPCGSLAFSSVSEPTLSLTGTYLLDSYSAEY